MLPNAPDGSVRGSDGSVRGPAVPGAGDCRARKGPGWLRERPRPSQHSAGFVGLSKRSLRPREGVAGSVIHGSTQVSIPGPRRCAVSDVVVVAVVVVVVVVECVCSGGGGGVGSGGGGGVGNGGGGGVGSGCGSCRWCRLVGGVGSGRYRGRECTYQVNIGNVM